MKAHSLIYLIPLVGITAVSCTSTRPLMDDDVYVMKTAEVPIGQDLLDETAYTTYVYRLNEEIPTNGYYDQSNASYIGASSWFMYGRYNNFGTLPTFYSPYWGAHRNGFYNIDGIFGMSGFGVYYGSGYFNDYGVPYSYYNGYTNFYGNYYGYNSGYYGNGFNNNNVFCFTGLNNNSNNTNVIGGAFSTGNHVSGPRATASGYYSGNNRGGSAQLKAQSTSSNSYNNSKPLSTARPIKNTTGSTALGGRNTAAKPQYTRNGSTNTQTARQTPSTRQAGSVRTNTSENSTRSTTTRSTTTRSTSTSPSTPRSTNTGSGGGNSGGRSGGSSGSSGGSGRSGGRGGM